MKKNNERRREFRQQCYVPVEGKPGSPFDNSLTVDISRNGIGFISPHTLKLEDEMAIELVLSPNSDPVLVRGKVRWVRPLPESKGYRVGMRFEDFLSGSKSSLKQYIAHT